MSRIIFICVSLVFSMQVLASDIPTKDLALEYLKIIDVEKMITANLLQYETIKSKNMNFEQKEKLHKHLEENASWNAIKDELIKNVQNTYTKQELELYVTYMSNPEATTFAEKSKEFGRQLSKDLQYKVNGINLQYK